MARKQSGVHFTYLVVAIVMCIGLIFWVVGLNSQLQQEKAQHAQAQKRVDEKETRIGELFTENLDLRRLTTGDTDSKPDPAQLQALLDRAKSEIGGALGKGELTYDSFDALYQDSVQAIIHLKGELDNQKALAEAKDQEYLQQVESKVNITAQKDEEIARLRDENNATKVQLERVRSEAADEAARLRDEVETITAEKEGEIYQLRRDLSISEGLKNRTERRLELLKREINKEQTFAIVEPDGELIKVSEDLGFAWVNLGKDHRLRRGTIFNVFQYVKGGKRQEKGRVEVSRIEDDFAEVKILETYDRFHPLATGDMVASPFYSSGDTPVFVFAGEKPLNNRLSKEELSRKIESFGGEVEATVRLEIDYVIAIKGYEETPQYKDARELGITVLRENELLDFIEY